MKVNSLKELEENGYTIVKNLVDLHGGTISASNNAVKKGANVEIVFPRS